MELPFSVHGVQGRITVDVSRNHDPAALGCDPVGAQDLAVCTATVDLPAPGYRALLGWVQLVSSTDGPSGEAGFDPDPLNVYADLATPYAFYGIRPVLFDAPSRRHRQDMRWVANSFLCCSPSMPPPRGREVWALQGFSWGFAIQAGEVSIQPAHPMPARSWDGHLARLAAAYPDWRFVPGFQRADSAGCQIA